MYNSHRMKGKGMDPALGWDPSPWMWDVYQARIELMKTLGLQGMVDYDLMIRQSYDGYTAWDGVSSPADIAADAAAQGLYFRHNPSAFMGGAEGASNTGNQTHQIWRWEITDPRSVNGLLYDTDDYYSWYPIYCPRCPGGRKAWIWGTLGSQEDVGDPGQPTDPRLPGNAHPWSPFQAANQPNPAWPGYDEVRRDRFLTSAGYWFMDVFPPKFSIRTNWGSPPGMVSNFNPHAEGWDCSNGHGGGAEGTHDVAADDWVGALEKLMVLFIDVLDTWLTPIYGHDWRMLLNNFHTAGAAALRTLYDPKNRVHNGRYVFFDGMTIEAGFDGDLTGIGGTTGTYCGLDPPPNASYEGAGVRAELLAAGFSSNEVEDRLNTNPYGSIPGASPTYWTLADATILASRALGVNVAHNDAGVAAYPDAITGWRQISAGYQIHQPNEHWEGQEGYWVLLNLITAMEHTSGIPCDWDEVNQHGRQAWEYHNGATGQNWGWYTSAKYGESWSGFVEGGIYVRKPDGMCTFASPIQYGFEIPIPQDKTCQQVRRCDPVALGSGTNWPFDAQIYRDTTDGSTDWHVTGATLQYVGPSNRHGYGYIIVWEPGGGQNQAPYPPSTPDGPEELDVDVLGTWSTSTYDPEGDKLQFKWRYGVPGNWDETSWDNNNGNYYTGGQTVEFTHGFASAGTFEIQARAMDDGSPPAMSAWSSSAIVVVGTGNVPPNSPVITGTETASIGDEVSLWARSYDPDGDQWYIDWKYAKPSGSIIQGPQQGPFDNEDDGGNLKVTVDEVGTWFFEAKATDVWGNWNGLWAVHDVVVAAPDETPPAPPNTPSGDNEVNTGEVGYWTTTTFDNSMQWQIQWWAGQYDPSNAVPITVDGFGNPTWVGPGDDPGEYFDNNELASIAHSFPVGDCDWYIGAAAKDPSGNVANVENWKKVTVLEPGDTEPPSDPATPWLHGFAYANGDVILVTTATDNSGEYRVEMQVQWVANPALFNVTVGDEPPYTWVPSGQDSETTVTLPDMVGFYRARAVAFDPSGNESENASAWFTFYAAQPDIYVPTVPTIPELIDGQLVAGTPGTFSTVSYIGGGEQWQVKWEVNGEDMGWGTTQDSGVAALTSVLFTYGDFEIRAKARNATYTSYESDWSEPFTGTVSDPVPLKPIKPYALDPLLANTPIRFATSSYDNTGWYWLRWEINGSQQTWEEANQVANGVLGLLTLTPDEGTLTLRAQAKDANNQESPWSNPATFIVEAIQERTRLTVHRVWVELKERRSRR